MKGLWYMGGILSIFLKHPKFFSQADRPFYILLCHPYEFPVSAKFCQYLIWLTFLILDLVDLAISLKTNVNHFFHMPLCIHISSRVSLQILWVFILFSLFFLSLVVGVALLINEFICMLQIQIRCQTNY